MNHYQNTDGGNQHLSNNTNSRLKMSQNINKGPYVVRQMQMPSPLFGLQTCIVLFFFFLFIYFFFFFFCLKLPEGLCDYDMSANSKGSGKTVISGGSPELLLVNYLI